MDLRHLATGHRPVVPRRDPHRGHQPHGSAGAGTQTNIDRVSVVERDVDTSTLIFELLVHDRKQLASVIRSVRTMPEVLKVIRTLA